MVLEFFRIFFEWMQHHVRSPQLYSNQQLFLYAAHETQSCMSFVHAQIFFLINPLFIISSIHRSDNLIQDRNIVLSRFARYVLYDFFINSWATEHYHIKMIQEMPRTISRRCISCIINVKAICIYICTALNGHEFR